MSLAAFEFGPEVVDAFLWGLLPDTEEVPKHWVRRFLNSTRNIFTLIANVSEDCAGKVQFVAPDRRDAVLSGNADKVEWLDEAGIAERLRLLREDHAAWRLARDTGQFSLAGAQPKTALLFENDRWGIPSGRIPTTHILKPPTGQFDGHAENEHICLMLARAFGLPAASSRVMHFGDEIAVVVERYDRVKSHNQIARAHQEDACQALGIHPSRKYQSEGGPGVAEILEMLRIHSSERDEDVRTFIDAIAFNWLIAGTDAHAKNYSVLIGGGPRVRLAPLYDVASILPYDHIDLHKTKLAMKIGGQYLLQEIGIRQWHKLAQEERIDGDALVERLRDMTQRLRDEASLAQQRAQEAGLIQPVVSRLTDALIKRAGECRLALSAAR